jgi:hypothetical protein
LDTLKKNSLWLLVVLFFASGIFVSSCKRDQFDTNPSTKLAFSTDTVLFDTVFTTLGGGPFPRSINQRLLVYNTSKNSIRTNIRLAGGAASAYRINIDGQRTTQVTDYEILGEDSIYVFVEVSINPLNGSDPFIKDSIMFETNGNFQDVKLVAWGQDAYYFNDSVLGCNIVWNDKSKPYVIYHSVLVPENCKLTIGEGVTVYSDVGSTIFVQGTLEVNGTKDNRVIFQGGRLGADFIDLPGQWGGIHFLTTSKNSSIKYADIVNGTIGVRCDSLPNNINPKATIENTLIKNMSSVGVLAFTSKISMVNCCVANCGNYTFGSDYGGDYSFTHCTFASYAGTFSRKDPSFIMSNSDLVDENGILISINKLNFDVRNTIIYGSLREEMGINRSGRGIVTGTFESNFLKTQIQGFDASNKINIDPKFKDYKMLDFKLDTLSPAKDAGVNASVLVDLEGTLRDFQPDIGSYERVE